MTEGHSPMEVSGPALPLIRELTRHLVHILCVQCTDKNCLHEFMAREVHEEGR